MTPEQVRAKAAFQAAQVDLVVARHAYDVAPVNPEVVRILATAIQTEADAKKVYMAAMTAELAAQMRVLPPDEWPPA